MTGPVAGLGWLAVAAAALAAALLPASACVRGAALPRAAPTRGGSRAQPRTEGLARFRGALAVAAGLAAVLLLGGPFGVLGALVAATLTWRAVGRAEPPSSRRRRERLLADLPTTVELLATCLAAGASPATALERVVQAVDGPVSEELAVIAGRLRLGDDPVRVWSDVGRHPQLAPLGRCLVRALDSGASVADAMRRLAEETRRSAAGEAESRARSVGVRAAVPLGICLLPAFLLLGIVPLVAGAVEMFLHG